MESKEIFMSKVWLTASGAVMSAFLCQRPNCFSFQITVYPKAAPLFAWLNNKLCNNIVKYTSVNIRGTLYAYDSVMWLEGPKAHFISNFLGLHSLGACGQATQSRGFCNGCIAVETICYATSEIQKRKKRQAVIFTANTTQTEIPVSAACQNYAHMHSYK